MQIGLPAKTKIIIIKKIRIAKEVAPDETARDELSHLDLPCLQRSLVVYWAERVKQILLQKYMANQY